MLVTPSQHHFLKHPSHTSGLVVPLLCNPLSINAHPKHVLQSESAPPTVATSTELSMTPCASAFEYSILNVDVLASDVYG